MASKRYRVWATVVYPESLPENYKDIISSWHVPVCLSPLHDKDLNPDDTPKKPHFHLLLSFAGVKDISQIIELTDQLNAVFPIPVNDACAMVRYFIHMDNPEKAQYKREDMVTFGGFDIDSFLTIPKSVIKQGIREISEFVLSKNITEFATLVDFCLSVNPEWFYIITQVSTNYFVNLIKSNRHRLEKTLVKGQ